MLNLIYFKLNYLLKNNTRDVNFTAYEVYIYFQINASVRKNVELTFIKIIIMIPILVVGIWPSLDEY